MLTAEALAAEEIHIWQAALDIGSDQAERWSELLSGDERERAARFRFERDRVRYIAGRAQLRMLLAGYLDASPAELVFSYGDNDKPMLAGDGPCFNLSHSGALALYAVTADVEVGIDVELYDRRASAVSGFRSASSRPTRCSRCGRFQPTFSPADSSSYGHARKHSSRPAETVFPLRWTAFPLP